MFAHHCRSIPVAPASPEGEEAAKKTAMTGVKSIEIIRQAVADACKAWICLSASR